jgi:tetratricopeptide (TPR) repeat protein
MTPQRIGAAFGLLVCLLAGTGCSTHAKRISLSRSLFYEGQLDACKDRLEKLHKSHRHDRDVTNLDLAVVDLLEGRSQESLKRLKDVRDRFDHLEQESISEKTISMWSDDTSRSYAGEDYEKILIRVYMALASLMHDGVDAESYTLQIQDKHDAVMQRLWGEKPVDIESNKFAGLPIGFYLRGLLREQTHIDYDDALRSYNQVAQLLPNCERIRWDIERVTHGVHSQPGCGVVYVFAMVGRGPYKVESVEEPTSDALFIADRIVSAVGPYKLPPTIAPITIPKVVVPDSNIDRVEVAVNRQDVGSTVSIADIDRLALETSQAARDELIARAVARRVIKKATVAAVKQQTSANNIASLGFDAAGVAWEALENADTRCWGLLPRNIQVLRIELPAGSHTIRLAPECYGQIARQAVQSQVTVIDGRNTYVIGWFPDLFTPARVLTSTDG